MTTAAEFIAGFEGYAGRAYWDVNHWRLGYGSDTEGPDQVEVTQGMETTKERALQNLALRIPKFAHEAVYGKTGMGADTWLGLSENQRTAILSLVYNYGRLPIVITPSDPVKTATAIDALQIANGGVNSRRRISEASFFLTGDATLPFHEAVKMATASQPAPPVPGSPVQAPQMPASVVRPPAAPAGLPSVMPSTAGLDAAILNNVGALHDVLCKQRDALAKRIAALEAVAATVADFEKLEEIAVAIPPPLQIQAAKPAAIIEQRSQKVFGITNWQTTLGGIVAGLAGIAIQIPQLAPYAPTIGLIATFFVGISAKDHNVTGGTISNVTGAVGTPVSLIEQEAPLRR